MRGSRMTVPAGIGWRRMGLLGTSGLFACALLALLLFLAGQARAYQPRDVALDDRAVARPQAATFTYSLSSPITWTHSPLTCTARITFADGLSTTAVYRTSTDGGATWSTAHAAVVVRGAAYTTATVKALNLSFPTTSATENRVQFEIRDLSALSHTVPADAGGFVMPVDNDAPGSPIRGSSSTGWTKDPSHFWVNWTNPADLSGIAKAYYKMDSLPTSNADYTGSATGTDIHALSNLSVSTAGKHPIYVWLQDKAGNTYYNTSNILGEFWYDPTPPISSLLLGGTVGTNGWYRSSVLVTHSATDATSGSGTIKSLSYKIDGSAWVTQTLSGPPYQIQYTVTGEGTHNVYYRATDGADNVETQRLQQIKIDSVNPATGYGLSGTTGLNGWYKGAVTVNLSPSDATSGVAYTNYRVDSQAEQTGTSFQVTADGVHQFRFHSTDVAGNPETELGPYEFKIDTRAPVVTVSLLPTLPATGWYNCPVTVTLSAADPDGVGSAGVATLSYRLDAGSWITTSVSLLNVQVTTDGLHTLYYRSADRAGNLSSTGSQIVKIDRVAPSMGSLTFGGAPGQNGWYTSGGIVTLAASDPGSGSGVSSIYYKLDSMPGYSLYQGLSVNTEGDHTLSAYAVDTAGNAGTVRSYDGQLRIDATAPTVTVTPARPPDHGAWYTATVAITITASDTIAGRATSGMQNVQYQLDGGSWQTVIGSQAVVTLYTGGTHTLSYRALDNAGNLSATGGPLTYKLDIGAPAIVGMTFSGTAGQNGWYTTGGTGALQVSDPDGGSGLGQVYYKLDNAPAYTPGQSFTISLPGAHIVNAYVTDTAGNQSPIYSNTVRIDGSAPNLTLTPSAPSNLSGWYTQTVTITLTASDVVTGLATSGVQAIGYRIDSGSWVTVTGALATVPIASDGSHTLTYRARDVAGNTNTPARTATVNLDRQAPTIDGQTFSGTPGAGNWYLSGGTLTLLASDPAGGSGVSQVYYWLDDAPGYTPGSSFTVSGEGVHVFAAYAVDAAGNPSQVYTNTVNIDATAPAVSLVRSLQPNAYGWYSNTVAITLTASDVVTGVLTSGVEAIEYRQGTGSWTAVSGPINFSSEGLGSYEARARDAAGNISATKPFTVYIDRTAPAAPLPPVNITPNTWSKTNNYTVTWTSPADLSGIARVLYTIDAVPDAPGVVPAGNVPVENGIARATGLQVPAEGDHLVFVWLMDKAGNASVHNYRTAVDHLRYDITPPTNARQTIAGSLGCAGYFTSPLTISLRADDAASGVGAFTWTTGTTWITSTTSGPNNDVVVTLTQDGKYTLRYKAIDHAGNVQATANTFSPKLDVTAPGAPVSLSATPVGWSSTPTFTVSFGAPQPADYTGIAGVLYALNRVPTKPSDGAFIATTYDTGTKRYTAPIVVPGEGSYTLYLWLRDVACNSNVSTVVTRTLRYDGTPPVTTMTRDRVPDHDTWYTRAVTVTFAATDGQGSGLDRTYYSVNGGAYQSGANLVLSQSGIYSIRYYSADKAGNLETEKGYQIKVDMLPPNTQVTAPTNGSTTGFTVNWGGSDVPDNRLDRYWVQFRDGTSGAWTMWQNGITATSATFVGGAQGHTYYFRCRASDEAGNESAWPSQPQSQTFVDPITNGDFANGLAGWTVTSTPQSGGLPAWQASATAGQCGASNAALLGSPYYDQHAVPIGAVTLTQSIDLPAVAPGQRLILSFRYRMMTWDVKTNRPGTVLFDTFEASVGAANGTQLALLLQDGNPNPSDGQTHYGFLTDLGCQARSYDVTAYAGSRIQFRFSNWNRLYAEWNTYTYLENVSVRMVASLQLPYILNRAGYSGNWDDDKGTLRPPVAPTKPAPAPSAPGGDVRD